MGKIPVQGGKCGVCGDAYGDVEPRQHEDGGKYGKGIITAQYQSGFEPSFKQIFFVKLEFSSLKKARSSDSNIDSNHSTSQGFR